MSKRRILIADDNEEFCQNMADILALKGFETVVVPDGFKAIEAVREDGFDLVLMDVKMPAMNGVETFKKLKELAPQTPVIMVTAFAVEDLLRDALRNGAFAALRKPIDFDKLFPIIDDTLPGGGMVLVVDDNENICESLSDLLTKEKYRVRVAGDGETAIRVVRENKFDIMILDIKLPKLNGLETYRAVRDLRPDLVTIFITGYRDEVRDQVNEALEQNAYICLEKPLDVDRLLSLIGRIEEEKSRGELTKPDEE